MIFVGHWLPRELSKISVLKLISKWACEETSKESRVSCFHHRYFFGFEWSNHNESLLPCLEEICGRNLLQTAACCGVVVVHEVFVDTINNY